MKKFRLFVYGTLRRGFSNHERFLKNAKFIGRAKTGFGAELYGSGIPFLKKTTRATKVVGEVYEINAEELERIDRLEGHPDFYRREEKLFTLENGLTTQCYVYQYPHAVDQESGPYTNYAEKRR